VLAINRRIEIYSRLVAMIDEYLATKHNQPTNDTIAIFNEVDFSQYSLLLLGMRERCRLNFFRSVLVQLLSSDTSILLNNHYRKLIIQEFSQKEQRIIFDLTVVRNIAIGSVILANGIERAINILMDIFFSHSGVVCKILWEHNYPQEFTYPDLSQKEVESITTVIIATFTKRFPSLTQELK
jgi:hypothetical protein